MKPTNNGPTWAQLTPAEQYRVGRLFSLILRLRREGKLPPRRTTP